MGKNEVISKYNELIASYLEIKPMLGSLYKILGNQYPDAILNEIRAINDHIARCYYDNVTVEEEYEELCKAEGHLKRCIFDCFKQLNILFFCDVEKCEKKYFGSHWLCYKNGSFWESYTEKRKSVVENIEEAKNYEGKGNWEDSLAHYQNAYAIQQEVYNLLKESEKQLQLNWLKRFSHKINTFRGWLWSTIVLSVIPMVIWELYLHWNEVIGFLLHLICKQ